MPEDLLAESCFECTASQIRSTRQGDGIHTTRQKRHGKNYAASVRLLSPEYDQPGGAEGLTDEKVRSKYRISRVAGYSQRPYVH